MELERLDIVEEDQTKFNSFSIEGFFDRAQLVLVPIFMGASTSILARTILTDFLKVPPSEVTPHLAVRLISTIVGLGIGYYLNTTDRKED